MDESAFPEDAGCPRPQAATAGHISLAHGEGGRLARQLIEQRILPRLGNRWLGALGDAAVLDPHDLSLPAGGRLALTTDSFVVSPWFFPGGDLGRLAVLGTCNDLAVATAQPQCLTLAMILEEGFSLAVLDQLLANVRRAADEVGVAIVAGDTKVVPRGAADGVFLTTTGLGVLTGPPPPGPSGLQPDDVLLVSGPIAQHGMAVLVARENLGLEPPPSSDCAALWPAVASLLAKGVGMRAIRDATRGGVAAVLHEWAQASGQTLAIDADNLPVTDEVRGACELLGLDPLHVANEGTLLCAVPPDQAHAALAALRAVPVSAQAVAIGRVQPRGPVPVVVNRGWGAPMPLDEPTGAPLPRIC